MAAAVIAVASSAPWAPTASPRIPNRIGAVAPAPWSDHLRIYLQATFLNTFTPANIGGDLYRALALKARAGGVIDLVVVLLRERVLGLLSFLCGYELLFSAEYATGGHGPMFFGSAALAIAGALVAIFAAKALAPRFVRWERLSRLPRTGRALLRLPEALAFGGGRAFGAAMALSLAALAIWILAVKVVADSLGLSLPVALLGMIVVLTELIRLVPISFQGIGVRELTFALLAGLAGAEAETGFLVGTLAYLALSLSLILAGALAWLLTLSSGDARS